MKCSEDLDFQLVFLLFLEHLACCPSSWAKMWPPKNFSSLQLQDLKILALSCRKVLSRHSPVASKAGVLWFWGFQSVNTSINVKLLISLSLPCVQGKMNGTWGWWCCGWDRLPMFSPPDQKDSPTEMGTSYILEHLRIKYFAKKSCCEVFSQWTSNPNWVSVNILNDEWNEIPYQRDMFGRSWPH